MVHDFLLSTSGSGATAAVLLPPPAHCHDCLNKSNNIAEKTLHLQHLTSHIVQEYYSKIDFTSSISFFRTHHHQEHHLNNNAYYCFCCSCSLIILIIASNNNNIVDDEQKQSNKAGSHNKKY